MAHLAWQLLLAELLVVHAPAPIGGRSQRSRNLHWVILLKRVTELLDPPGPFLHGLLVNADRGDGQLVLLFVEPKIDVVHPFRLALDAEVGAGEVALPLDPADGIVDLHELEGSLFAVL